MDLKIKRAISHNLLAVCRMLMISLAACQITSLHAQTTETITVGGDIGTFYPVAWLDGNYHANKATSLSIGRSQVHTDSQWRGSLVASFVFHTCNWGNSADFINANIATNMISNTVHKSFIAGWHDATNGNGDRRIIIWLRGGGTTYYYSADANVDPKVHDGVQNTLPYVSSNGDYTAQVKTTVDTKVIAVGQNFQHPINVYAGGSNYLQGNLGIGRRNPNEKLEVDGTIRAKEIKVEASPWPDYVFEDDYVLPSLKETEKFIRLNKHLPDVPSAKDVEDHGIALGEMNAILLKKVEELTLHLIEKDKQINSLISQKEDVENLKKQVDALSALLYVHKP